jgi:hypothetical protein
MLILHDISFYYWRLSEAYLIITSISLCVICTELTVMVLARYHYYLFQVVIQQFHGDIDNSFH